MFAVAVAALGFSSCSETWDDNPVIKTHEGVEQANFLNTPSMADQNLMITRDNMNGTLHLTCSQPDFGYAATAIYRVQLSLTEDFADFREISEDFYDCGAIDPLNADVASAIEYLAGVLTEDDLPVAERNVFVRLRAFIPQMPETTEYISNVICYKAIGVDYLAIWISGTPVNIYLRGGMNGWDPKPEYQFVTGPYENTWVTGDITIDEGTEFKVADDSWGALNAGAGAAGHEVKVNDPLKIDNGNNPGNLLMTEDFHGFAFLQLEKGVYTLTMVTEAE